MSVDFATDLPAPEGTEESPCLCAQMCDAFFQMFRGAAVTPELRSELRTAADPGCPRCGGSGIEVEPVASPHRLNMNQYGFTMLRALGLPAEPHGQCTIADARRALLRADNTDVRHLLVDDETTHRRPCADEDGAVVLRPVRSHVRGLSRADLARRLNDFRRFVQLAAEAGATVVYWS